MCRPRTCDDVVHAGLRFIAPHGLGWPGDGKRAASLHQAHAAAGHRDAFTVSIRPGARTSARGATTAKHEAIIGGAAAARTSGSLRGGDDLYDASVSGECGELQTAG